MEKNVPEVHFHTIITLEDMKNLEASVPHFTLYTKAAEQNRPDVLRLICQLDDDARELEPEEALFAGVKKEALLAVTHLLQTHSIGIKSDIHYQSFHGILEHALVHNSDDMVKLLVQADQFDGDVIGILVRCKKPDRIRSVLGWVTSFDDLHNSGDPTKALLRALSCLVQEPQLAPTLPVEIFEAFAPLEGVLPDPDDGYENMDPNLKPFFLKFLVKRQLPIPLSFLRDAWKPEKSHYMTEWYVKGCLLNARNHADDVHVRGIKAWACSISCKQFRGCLQESENQNKFDLLACAVIGGALDVVQQFYKASRHAFLVKLASVTGQWSVFLWLVDRTNTVLPDIDFVLKHRWSHSPDILQIIRFLLGKGGEVRKKLCTRWPALLQILLESCGHKLPLSVYLKEVVQEGGGPILDVLFDWPHGNLTPGDFSTALAAIQDRGWPKLKDKLQRYASQDVTPGVLCSRQNCVECVRLLPGIKDGLSFLPDVLLKIVISYYCTKNRK